MHVDTIKLSTVTTAPIYVRFTSRSTIGQLCRTTDREIPHARSPALPHRAGNKSDHATEIRGQGRNTRRSRIYVATPCKQQELCFDMVGGKPESMTLPLHGHFLSSAGDRRPVDDMHPQPAKRQFGFSAGDGAPEFSAPQFLRKQRRLQS